MANRVKKGVSNQFLLNEFFDLSPPSMRKVDKEGKIDFFGTPPKAVFISGQKKIKKRDRPC